MVEQGIYFALGCIVTALGALAFAPIFWRRALRLTKHRMQAQAPMSMQEILAERDVMRARFAVDRLRLEQEVDRIRAGKAADLADLGRRTAAVATLTEELLVRRRLEEAQDREIATLQREMAETAAEFGAMNKALHDFDARASRQRERAEEARRAAQVLEGELERRRMAVATLEARAAGLEMQLGESERSGAARLRVADAEAAALRLEMEAELGRLRQEVASLARAARDADAARLATEATLVEVKAAAGAFADDAREREKAAALQSSLKGERVRSEHAEMAADLSARLTRATDEVAALRRERDEARAAMALRESESAGRAGPPPGREPGDAELRDSIHALGLAVAELTREAKVGATSSGAPPPAAPMPSAPIRQVADAR